MINDVENDVNMLNEKFTKMHENVVARIDDLYINFRRIQNPGSNKNKMNSDFKRFDDQISHLTNLYEKEI